MQTQTNSNSFSQVHFSSRSEDWFTPDYVFNDLNEEYGPFELDAAASNENAKCGVYYTKTVVMSWGIRRGWYLNESLGALGIPWKSWTSSGDIIETPNVWLNPPYGRKLGKWIEKAYTESQRGCRVVCLIPARTDTRWFHDYVSKAKEVWFIKGRLKFGGATNSAPFPSMVVVFEPGNHDAKFGLAQFQSNSNE